jgi:hypothetical protein
LSTLENGNWGICPRIKWERLMGKSEKNLDIKAAVEP